MDTKRIDLLYTHSTDRTMVIKGINTLLLPILIMIILETNLISNAIAQRSNPPGDDETKFLYSFKGGLGGEGKREDTYEYFHISVAENWCDVASKDNYYFVTGCYSNSTYEKFADQKRSPLPPVRGGDDVTEAYIAMFENKTNKLVVLRTSQQSTSLTEGTALCLDNNGHLYSAGTLKSTIKFSNLLFTKIGLKDAFIVKSVVKSLKTDRDFQYQIGGLNAEVTITKIRAGKDNYIYIVGRFKGRIKFPSNTTPIELKSEPTRFGIFYAKIDGSSGNTVWAKSAGNEKEDSEALGLDLDKDDNLYITGYYKGKAEFEQKKRISSKGEEDIFIAKINSDDGSCVWLASSGGEKKDKAYSITISPDGNCFITGEIFYEAQFNSADDFKQSIELTATFNRTNFFYAKYSAQGQLLAADVFRSPNDCYAFDIKHDGNEHLYITGAFRDYFIVKNDTIPNATDEKSASYNAFLAKFRVKRDNSPIFEFVHPLGYGGYRIKNRLDAKETPLKWAAIGKSIAFDSKKNVYLVGYSVGDIPFGDDRTYGVKSNVPVIFFTKFGSYGE